MEFFPLRWSVSFFIPRKSCKVFSGLQESCSSPYSISSADSGGLSRPTSRRLTQGTGTAMDSGKWIRELREERFVKSSDIERISRSIADVKGNADFYVSHSTLADVETGSVPSIHKLFSLAACLKVSLEELLLVFGIDANEVKQFVGQTEAGVRGASAIEAREPGFRFQLNFDNSLNSHETSLLRLNPQELAALPPALRKRLDPRRYRYAVVGLKDDTMGDLIPPGSLVEVDVMQNAVQVFDWRSMRERPVYLVWHTDGHSCCWCQLEGKELTLLPYPLSRQPVRRFKVPREASVIGRVINAWLPFDQLPNGGATH
jgi:transcriptional regulator with XRE-family HTH domain